MDSLNNIFNYIKRGNFLIDYCNLNPKSGINHRFTGRGTNTTDKKVELTNDDKKSIKAGLIKYKEDIEKVITEIECE